jgi:hypothetical protein
MDSIMTEYRIYDFDGTGRILTRTDTVCHDDKAAFSLAAAMFRKGKSVEVWTGARMVAFMSGASHNIAALMSP